MNHRKIYHILSALLLTLIVFTFNPAQALQTSNSARVTIVESTNSGLQLEMELLDLQIIPDEQFDDVRRIILPDESEGGRPGYPDLPRVTRMVAVPDNKAIQLEWSSDTPRSIHLGMTTVAVYENSEAPTDAIERVEAIEFYPVQVVEMSEPAIMRGVRLVQISINPVQYNSQSGELRIYDNVTIKLNYTPDPTAVPGRSREKYASATVDDIIRGMVVNPQDVRRDNPSRDAIRRGSYVYVIPDYSDDDGSVAGVIAPLVEWRMRQGYHTEVITVARNATNVDVTRALRNAYFEWEYPPEVICLVGDGDLQNADFMIPSWDVGRVYMWETDYKFVLLDGDDLLPEAAIGRISARNIRELQRIVQTKILAYETNPHMEDDDGNPDVAWFTRAALMANDDRTGYSSVYLQRWLRSMLLEVGFTEVDTVYFIHGRNQAAEHNFIRNNINNQGISVFNYRGWAEFNGAWGVNDVRELTNGSRLPLMILPTCNTADFVDHIQNPHAYAEDFLWGQEGGAIGTIGSSGFTHTNYNNVLDGGILNGIYRDKNWRQGWALNQGKVEMWRHFGQFNDVVDPQVQDLLVWEAMAYQQNLIGDPGTEIWTAVPQVANLECVDELSVGETQLMSIVTDSESDEPVPDVLVTLLYNGELIRNLRTDGEGQVVFTFEPGELDGESVLQLTATRHNMKPIMHEISVVIPEVFVGVNNVIIDDDNAGRSRGNGDGVPNPGETVELRVFYGNFGDNPAQGQLTTELTCVMGGVEITTGAVDIQAPAMQEESRADYLITIDQTAFNNDRVVFHMVASSGEMDWDSGYETVIGSSDIEYASHRFIPNVLHIGDTVLVDVTVRNIGTITSPAMAAQLVSGSEVVNVFNDRADLAPVTIDGMDSLTTARFRIHAHDLTVPGTEVTMTVRLTTETGFTDEVHFDVVVDQPESDTPFGPDAYGYVCFDDTDENWPEVAPVYDWVEIDTALGGPGTDTGIRDLGNEQDWSVLVELPEDFHFQYYGEEFSQISICSNGWFAFGDQSKLADFQNRRIPPALGPRAQVCVFWDDLVNYTQNNVRIGGVYYYYDADNHRFIIEWSQMRRYLGMDGQQMRPGGVNTFQAILYDATHYPSYTGDGDIVFQYQTVNNDPDVDPLEFDTPYATVGIVNLNGTDGMEYTYWNEYADGAAELQNERAIKFSTKLIVVVGAARGVVVDAETNQAIPGAQVSGNRGSFALTNDNGEFQMDHVLVGDGYQFTAWASGYNSITLDSMFTIVEGQIVNMQFRLTHPEFNLSQEGIEQGLKPDTSRVIHLTLSNDGNGPLSYRSYFDYLDGDEDARWNRLLNANVTEQTQDHYIQGIGFFENNLWVTGSGNRRDPKFYLFNREGSLVRTIDQDVLSSYGFRDVAVDLNNGLLYGGEDQWLVGVNSNGEPVDSIPSSGTKYALAYDPVMDVFWAGRERNPIVMIDRDGNINETIGGHELNVQGLGWYEDDPDDHPLYILSSDRTNQGLEIQKSLVSKMNPETGDKQVVAVLEGVLSDNGGGMEITNAFDTRKWVMVAILTNPDGDRLSVYDMGPNTNWISYEPRFGDLQAESSTELNLTISSRGLEDGDYGLSIHFDHNAAGLQTIIPIRLNVNERNSVDDQTQVPLVFSLGQNYPNPFNPVTSIPFSLPEAVDVQLSVFDILGREVAVLVNEKLQAGYHQADFDALALPSGVYLVKLQAGNNIAFIKTALLK